MTTFKEYRDEINRIFAQNIRSHFVDYYHCNKLGNELTDLIIEATKELALRREYKELFDLANKSFLKWGKTDKDDSGGETQIVVYYVKQAWDVIYEADDSKIPHVKMYDWFESHLDGSVIDYMEDELYEYLVHHFSEPELLQRKYDFLNSKIEDGLKKNDENYYKYQVTQRQEYLLYVMADMGKPIEEIREYAKDLNINSVKKVMIEIEKRYGNMDAVIDIYKELAKREDEFGWATENWHIKLMEIYKERGDEEQYLRELVSAMALNIGNEELWKEYKSCFTAEEWPERCEEIFSNIRGTYRILPWYALEDRFDLIMEAIEISGDTDSLKRYEKKLKALYPDRCLKVLVEDTEAMAERSNKRQDYWKVARNLRWIQRYPGGNEKAAKLADKYREKYKRRRAMMEELEEF